MVDDLRLPVPRQQFIKPVHRMSGDAREDVGEPGLRIDAIHLRRDNETVHGRGALPAAIGSAEQPRFSSQRDAAQPSFRSIVGQAHASVLKEQRERGPTLEHVIDGFDQIMPAGEPGELRAHIGLEIVDQRPRLACGAPPGVLRRSFH